MTTQHCPACHSNRPVLKDGTLRQHDRLKIVGGWKPEHCPGSSRHPYEVPQRSGWHRCLEGCHH